MKSSIKELGWATSSLELTWQWRYTLPLTLIPIKVALSISIFTIVNQISQSFSKLGIMRIVSYSLRTHSCAKLKMTKMLITQSAQRQSRVT